MQAQIGLELCTAGSAEVLTAQGQYAITAGTLILHSPVFPMLELSRSADYASVELQERIENMYSLIAPNISSPQHFYAITPFLHLIDEQQAYFRQCIERIRTKEQQLAYTNHPMQRKMLSKIITLLRQETLLEHGYLFTDQLQHTEATPSRKRQVLVTFFWALNQEYKQHRAVQYYADKQGLSPRHFADIVKQESGYTPMDWINMVTINQAKYLLRQPDILVKQVADELGFPEQFTFRKYFKSHTGQSPTEYQQAQKTVAPSSYIYV
jgi:AraC-type DNA-binding domain-containing proteins